jgi:hypothetical protein
VAPVISGLPIEEIRESLNTRIYVSERGSPQIYREAAQDIGFCAFCTFQARDRQLLAQHYASHEEIRRFKDSVWRESRKYEGLCERRRQISESLERLRSEGRALDREIRGTDNGGRKFRREQLSKLTFLGL